MSFATLKRGQYGLQINPTPYFIDRMELRKFITQSLLDIIGGVQDAQKGTDEGCIVPNVARTFQAVEHGVSELQIVEFDVTVKADERAGSEAKVNVVAAVIGGGVKGQSDKSDGHAATLKFKVPVRFPVSNRKKEESKPK